jgi:fucose 4-O-acetylase-like acetyltransferase
MHASEKEQDALKDNRIHFLDNLRTFAIFLVVLCHAGGVYESSGIWGYFWVVDDPATNNMAGLVNLVLDIFMMPTIFFISGYLVLTSLKTRTPWAFIKAKFTRLMLPWLVSVLTLIPLYKVIFLYSRNLPQESWTTYFHWSNGIWNQNWLWFLPVLFLFNVVYLLLSKARIKLPNISLRSAIVATFIIGFTYSFAMDMLGLRGWTKTALLDFQNERLLIYFMAFLVGALCFQRKVFDAKPGSRMLYHVVNAVDWIPITVYIVFLLYPLFRPGQFIVSHIIDTLIVWFCFHLSLLCLLYVTIETFRRYLDRRGKLWDELNSNSYYVYIIHVIVTGALALAMLNTAIPSLAKYAILSVSTFVASHLIVSLCRRVSILSQDRLLPTGVQQHAGACH